MLATAPTASPPPPRAAGAPVPTVEEIIHEYGLPPAEARAVYALAVQMGPGFREYFQQLNSQALEYTHANTTPLTEFGPQLYYIPETASTIQLLPHQTIILDLMFNPLYAQQLGVPDGFQTLVFSTVKKSGKTSIAAMAARWVTETWGKFNEVYSIANDKEQARGRIYAKALQSVQLDPRWSARDKQIPNYWSIIEREATHIPSGSYLRAVSNDYRGEAGSNPTATFWSELWGYTHEASRRLWDEMTPVPTRPRSIRFVETYAGFVGESELLIKLYDQSTKPSDGARRLTREDLANCRPALEWPFDEVWDPDLPLFINPSARTFAYWDEGERARRMPWQTPAYYASQRLRPEAFDRLHLNRWVSATAAFIPIEWWLSCASALPVLTERDEPVIIGADASVSGDCTSLVMVSRDPNNRKHTALRKVATFFPPSGGTLNYNAPGGFKETLRDWIRNHRVTQVAYDPYQLHDVMVTMREEESVWTRPFSQGDERLVADFGLYVDIRDKNIVDYTSDPNVVDHMRHADARIQRGSNTKLRIVKRTEDGKIDNVVALSMANAECKRLNLE